MCPGIYGIIILLLIGSYFFNNAAPVKEVPYSTFEEYVKQGLVEKIDVYSTKNTLSAKINQKAVKKVFGDKSELYGRNE